MTDRPRFETPKCPPDEAHNQYHGGRLVEFTLRVADHWRARRIPESVDGMAARAMMRHLAEVERTQRRTDVEHAPLVYPPSKEIAASEFDALPADTEDRTAFAFRVVLVIAVLGLLTFAVWVGTSIGPADSSHRYLPNSIAVEREHVSAR